MLTILSKHTVRRHDAVDREQKCRKLSAPYLDRGTLKAILRKAGLSNDEFTKLLR
jgi:hypothetical protein